MNSCRSSFFIISLLVFGVVFSGISYADTHIAITSPMSPPGWALMEQELLRSSSKACEEYFATYFDERGYHLHQPRWGTLDGMDDVIEIFRGWTLLYALGGSESVLELYKKGLDGHILQYTDVKTDSTDCGKYGSIYKEFVTMLDWHHISESWRGFQFQGLADPTDIKYQKRARRYAGMYMNEDPDAPNYDPEHKIIRSIFNGSRGPMLRRATMYDWVGDPQVVTVGASHTFGRFVIMPLMDRWWLSLRHCAQYLEMAGDNPLNLMATDLAFNAYALAHEEKYKNWLLEYVDAWKERIDKNGGNIPTNIGLDGTIGGEFDGKWYGGTYGWDFYPWIEKRQNVAFRNMFWYGPWKGFGNALMLTGDQSYIDVLRRQIDNIYAQKKIIDGKVMLPRMYGELWPKDGPPEWKIVNGELTWKEKKLGEPKWYYYSEGLYIPQLTDIYLWSMDRKDLERIPKEGWIGFLEGRNPDYPEQALKREFEYVRSQMEKVRNDPTTPDTRAANAVYVFEPSAPVELTKLMFGGYLYSSKWKLNGRVRYFDPAKRRAGIPEDVGALVTEMNNDTAKIILVNINQLETRDVIVQTGAYGEHQCLRVEIGSKSYPVNNKFFNVRLAPGAGAELVIYHHRYANQPTLAFPWHGDTVPFP